jgi:hypothetical protein
MNPDKTAYWIALGVLALGLNSEYRQGNLVPVHRLVDRAGSVICHISTGAREVLASATALKNNNNNNNNNEGFSNEGFSVGSLQASAQQDESELIQDQASALRDRVRSSVLAHAEIARAHAQIEMRRAEVEQTRSRAQVQFAMARVVDRHVTAICSRTGTRIAVSREIDPADASSRVEVESTF